MKLAIVGYGQFGHFMAKHLRPYFIITPIRRSTSPEKIEGCDVVIFAVPFSDLEGAVKKLKKHIKNDALIVDVTSVKQKPLTILSKNFKGYEILGTHPIFGPQSGKAGLENLPIVLCNISFSGKHFSFVKKFLSKEMGLKVIVQSPGEHDREMGYIQGLTHFIGRALMHMDMKTYATNTKSYNHLLELKELLSKDSWKLFETIQNTNPEAKKVRTAFLKELESLNKSLKT